jgi:hypothetical protein
MARGIHLKNLRTADLEAIGVPESGLPEGAEERPFSLLAEADPVLSRTVDEVRQGLEATLMFLDEALSVASASQPTPEFPAKSGS